ncbi:MAG: methylated-DNA--[protein]-cysteine S-methyltransferase [Lewinellaceae bacterium]|nr:methylated-DNA--[protein]-cysteine S-methyltransferase [Lewinellaceae bacterium]
MESKAYFKSPLGILEIVATLRGIRSIKFVERRGKNSDPMPDLLENCLQQLAEYFEGNRREFKLPFDWSGEPEFHQEVWRELLEIPYGHTTSYLAIAEKLGNPKAVRAVGQANAHNPIAIVVPCHRVIAKSGDLQGYFYGLDVKRQLLELENPMSFARQGDLFS